MARSPDSLLEARIGYIDRIIAAQALQKDGYLNTYAQLIEPEHRWRFYGGMHLRIQGIMRPRFYFSDKNHQYYY